MDKKKLLKRIVFLFVVVIIVLQCFNKVYAFDFSDEILEVESHKITETLRINYRVFYNALMHKAELESKSGVLFNKYLFLIFPMVIGIISVIMCLIQIIVINKTKKHIENDDKEKAENYIKIKKVFYLIVISIIVLFIIYKFYFFNYAKALIGVKNDFSPYCGFNVLGTLINKVELVMHVLLFLNIIIMMIKENSIKKLIKDKETDIKLDSKPFGFLIALLCLACFSFYYSYHGPTVEFTYYPGVMSAKPIIYLYPVQEQVVTVELENKELLTTSYPKYEDNWKVLAKPNGDLVDLKTGRNLYALYWEGNKKVTDKTFKQGWCIKGEDTAKFLEEKLAGLGLNDREAEEFIVYWLPQLEKNKYNLIKFETQEQIDYNMPLNITPKPDTVIRVMMDFKGTNSYKELEPQELVTQERIGYTVVEWGGSELK